MKTFPSIVDLSQAAHNADSIVSNWLNAVLDFHQNYSKLERCVRQQSTDGKAAGATLFYSGQCPTDSLVALTVTMKSELKMLLRDMNEVNTLNESVANHERLKTHTLLLMYLNQQAETRLYLTKQSPS